ncbi:MAG: ATP-binding cassette domain-containing protein [Oligoflexia bacterium]|nr:ATP-binding cassette domain-containing protein [Oligoflexia bacterium]MBF0364324.1 ATP-binding cassette domain-containing protein [Oligoflexia bacterium]
MNPPPLPSPIIQVKNLVAKYGEKTVLEDIVFEISTGDIFMIVGGSGCGKTTLLKHMIGLLEPFSGQILIDGEDLFTSNAEKQLLILRKIGVLFQSGALFASLKVLANIQLPLKELTNLPEEAIVLIAKNKLKMVGLSETLDIFPAELSGGMQKRVAVARAMALDPQILFLDEPTSGLDPISASEMDNLIVTLAKILGITFVIISHDLISITRIGKKVIFLHEGHVIAQGDPRELKQHPHPLVMKFFSREQ